ncbi:MAG: deoxynucleoside kinase [Ignavibacteria bacterium]|nr:deoxynucleoside kinase [Ignavibacteria bacterium]
MAKNKFVTIAGNIGSGKSSLTKLIAERYQWIPYFESVGDNPYLKDFYADMNRWSFNLQIYFLSHRFRIHKEITNLNKSVIQDRSIYEDVEIFAKNLYKLGRMSERDYETYNSLFKEMIAYLNPPDLLVYLKADISTLLDQIRHRGRDFEKNIEVSYLEELNSSYNEWIERYKYGKSLIIESDSLDFVSSSEDLDKIANMITGAIG